MELESLAAAFFIIVIVLALVGIGSYSTGMVITPSTNIIGLNTVIIAVSIIIVFLMYVFYRRSHRF